MNGKVLNMTTLHTHTESSTRIVSSLFPMADFCLKNSIHALVSASIPLFVSFNYLLLLFLSFDLKAILFLPVIINLYSSPNQT